MTTHSHGSRNAMRGIQMFWHAERQGRKCKAKSARRKRTAQPIASERQMRLPHVLHAHRAHLEHDVICQSPAYLQAIREAAAEFDAFYVRERQAKQSRKQKGRQVQHAKRKIA